MSAIKILHTVPGVSWGGLEQRTLETALWQTQAGHDVIVAAPAASTMFRRARDAGLPAAAIEFRMGWRPQLLLSLRDLVKRHGTDIMDTHCNRDSGVAICCMDLCAIVRTRHSKNHHPKHSPWRRLRWRATYDHVIATASTIRDELVEERVVLAGNVSTIGEWAGEAFFATHANHERSDELGSRFGLHGHLPIVAAIGVMRLTKGYEYLLQATALLKKRGVALQCAIIGGSRDGEEAPQGYFAELIALAAMLGVAEQTVFTGFVEDVAGILQLPNIVVVPSTRESQTRVIPQAFASGKPVIAFAVGGIPELVIPGLTGILVPAGDVAALADAIEAAIAAPEASRALGRQARGFADRNLRFPDKMNATILAYEQAISRPRLRRIRPRRQSLAVQ